MIMMKKTGLVMMGAVLVAVMGSVSLAQVRQVQMGGSMDANPAVGSGGSNKPVQGYVPINGNDIVSGNVSGLSYFHGRTATTSTYQFQGPLGSSQLGGFARQTAGGPNGTSQVYFLPSATVSTGSGSLYQAPIGSGFDSGLIPRVSVSPTATGAQVSAITQNAMANSQAINRALPALSPLPGSPGAVLSSPLFSLRIPEELPSVSPETNPPSDEPATLKTPRQLPGGKVTEPGETTPENPGMVQGATGGTGDKRVTSRTDELKGAQVSDTYMQLAEELNNAQGLPGTENGSGKEPGQGKSGGTASGAAYGTGQGANFIDPLTGKPRQMAVLPKAGTGTGGLGQTGKVTEPSLSAKGLTDLSTAELTAGSKVKPVKLTAAITAGAPVSPFETMMTRGEQNLKAGKYLDAVESYQTALAIKPEDPLALVGRSHAELGAGIYSSAAYDLKFVFTRKPGMVSVKYDVQSFIPAARQEFLLEDLQKMTAKKETADMASFLYCYLCYETGRNTALQAELKKWSDREGHDEWVGVVSRAWGTK